MEQAFTIPPCPKWNKWRRQYLNKFVKYDILQALELEQMKSYHQKACDSLEQHSESEVEEEPIVEGESLLIIQNRFKFT